MRKQAKTKLTTPDIGANLPNYLMLTSAFSYNLCNSNGCSGLSTDLKYNKHKHNSYYRKLVISEGIKNKFLKRVVAKDHPPFDSIVYPTRNRHNFENLLRFFAHYPISLKRVFKKLYVNFQNVFITTSGLFKQTSSTGKIKKRWKILKRGLTAAIKPGRTDGLDWDNVTFPFEYTKTLADCDCCLTS